MAAKTAKKALQKTTADEIAQLEAVRRGLENKIRVTQTDMSRPDFVEKSIKEHLDKIAWHEEQIAAMRTRQVMGPTIIAEARDRIAAINKQINAIRNKREIDRMKKLQAEMAALRSSMTDEEYRAFLAQVTGQVESEVADA